MSATPAARTSSLLALLFCLSLAQPPLAYAATTTVRVATWNVETVGSPGSAEYEAALDVLERIGAHVVAVNEIASAADTTNLSQLATDAGYSTVVVPSSNPFGADRNAILTTLPVLSQTINTSADLSGDAAANDLSRLLVEVTLDVPGDATDLTVVSAHWKSGTGNDDEFRRVVESRRMAQAVADLDPLYDAYILLGDVNEEADNVPQSPDPIVSEPSGLPASFDLGADLEAELLASGFANDPFSNLSAAQVSTLGALQLDGLDSTRPASGRRLDYVFISPVIVAAGALGEVYDSNDEGLAGGLPKYGAALPSATSATASDHLLVFADVELPPLCGNGRLDGTEECDEEGANGTPRSCCASDCSFKPDGAASCDATACTRLDTCLRGVCTPGPCAGGETCSICGGTCSDAAGDCVCEF